MNACSYESTYTNYINILSNFQHSGDPDEKDQELLDSVNPQQRVRHLERSIAFLRSQHDEVLKSLHIEVEKLKKFNKGVYKRNQFFNKIKLQVNYTSS